MENKNLNFIFNNYVHEQNKNIELKQNKSYKGTKSSIYKRNHSLDFYKNKENGCSLKINKEKTKNGINTEINIINLIKENQSLQNELKIEKNKKQKNNKKINILKETINNLVSEQDKNIISTQNISNFNKIFPNNNNLTYADILFNVQNIVEENNKLKLELSEFSKIKIKNFELTNELMENKETLNELKSINFDLEKKIEKSENKTSKLYEKLKEFQKFEEIKLINDSLNKSLKIKNEEIIELNKILKEKEKQINDLKCMKYDDKLFILEQELNECKLEETKYINEIIKMKSDLNDIKKKYQMNINLLEQSQKTIKENRLNIEDNINKCNNLKNEYNSLKNLNNKLNIENNNLKEKNSKIILELNESKEYYIRYKEELNKISNQLIKIKNEKEKKEIYYLNQISMLQRGKNYMEKSLNEIKDKFIFTQNFENVININNEKNMETINLNNIYNEKYLKKKYEIAINEINSYNNDNKKLFILSKQLKSEINLITEEKIFYINIINKIIEGKYIDSKYDKLIKAVKKCIENYLDIQIMNKNKIDLEQKLIKYEKIMKNMNKKIESGETGMTYEINKNFYDVDDFSEITKIQNQLITINEKLNILYENKINIKKEIETC